MSWSRGCTEGFKNLSNVCMISTSLAHKKSDPCKGTSVSSDLGILYPAPKIPNPNLNFKLRWRKILPLAPHNYFLLVPTWIFLGIVDAQRFFWGVPLCFYPLGFTMLILSWGTTWMVKWLNDETNSKWWNGYIVISCDIISFGQTYKTANRCSFSKHLEEILLGDSSLLFPTGVYYHSTFLGNYTNHKKYKIAYVPLTHLPTTYI